MSAAKSRAPGRAPAGAAARARAQVQLRERLGAATHWDAEYHDAESASSLTNPLPVALAALHRLGATERRLNAFSAHCTARLHPAPALEAWPAGDPWRDRFGDPHAWPAYRHLFRQWLAHEGVVEVLQQALPYLLPGCGAAAFQGLVRTASAFEAVAPEALADALAYWACRWLDLGSAPAGAPATAAVRDPGRLVPALCAGRPCSASLIVHRMVEAASAPGFDAALAPLRIDEQTLPRLARLAAQRYARSGSFTLLHLVTGAHALRVLLPFADDPATAVAAYWRACAAALAAAGEQPPARAAPLLDWPALVQAAVASDDMHLAALVDACRQEQAAHGGAPDWQRAASRAVHEAARRGGRTRAAAEPAC